MSEAIQVIIFIVALVALSPLLGKYKARVFMGEKHIMKPVFSWFEKSVYRVSGVKSEEVIFTLDNKVSNQNFFVTTSLAIAFRWSANNILPIAN